MKNSAGIIIYRKEAEGVLILLVHSRGPVAQEPWSIPKGEFDKATESPPQAAVREVKEELVVSMDPSEIHPLGEAVYRNKKKRVFAFAWETKGVLPLTVDPAEIGQVKFVSLAVAKKIIHPAQVSFY